VVSLAGAGSLEDKRMDGVVVVTTEDEGAILEGMDG
jgi:hypothetical protein